MSDELALRKQLQLEVTGRKDATDTLEVYADALYDSGEEEACAVMKATAKEWKRLPTLRERIAKLDRNAEVLLPPLFPAGWVLVKKDPHRVCEGIARLDAALYDSRRPLGGEEEMWAKLETRFGGSFPNQIHYRIITSRRDLDGYILAGVALNCGMAWRGMHRESVHEWKFTTSSLRDPYMTAADGWAEAQKYRDFDRAARERAREEAAGDGGYSGTILGADD